MSDPSAKVKVAILTGALRDIAVGCEDTAAEVERMCNDRRADKGEIRAWRSMSKRAYAALAKAERLGK